MKHHNMQAYNNENAVSLNAVCGSFNTKEEMQKLMIDLTNKKNRGENLAPFAVVEIEFYDFGPEQQANVLKQNGEDDEWFFFTRRKPVSPGSTYASRNAGGGKWEQNGARNPILHDGKQRIIIGYQRFFEYKRGGKSKTSDWRLYEFEELNPLRNPADKLRYDYVLCKLYKLSSTGVPSNNNNGKNSKKNRKTQKQERKAAANSKLTTTMQDQSQNPRSSSSQLFQALKARFDIDDIHNETDSNTVAHGDDDYYKLTESERRLLDTGDWVNMSLDGFHGVLDYYFTGDQFP